MLLAILILQIVMLSLATTSGIVSGVIAVRQRRARMAAPRTGMLGPPLCADGHREVRVGSSVPVPTWCSRCGALHKMVDGHATWIHPSR